jgi:hypothetical protein
MLEKEKGIDAVTDQHAGPHPRSSRADGHGIGQARVLPETADPFGPRSAVLTQAAERYGVQTQMGNQAHAGEPIRRAVELVRAGVIGPVREVHAWTNRPIWPQGQAALDERIQAGRPAEAGGLDWDLWLGPLRTGRSTVATCRSVGAVGGTSAPVRWGTWRATSSTWPTGRSTWIRRLRSRPNRPGLTDETGPLWSTITYQFPHGDRSGGGDRAARPGPERGRRATAGQVRLVRRQPGRQAERAV